MARHTQVGAAFGTDLFVVAALARLSRPGWGGIRRSASLRELAEAAECGEAKVAIAMKYAVKAGLAEKAGPRTVQQTWIATAKADALIERKR